MLHHPSLQGRRLALVGPVVSCFQFLEDHDIDRFGVIIADSHRKLVGRQPDKLHIVVMPGVLDLWKDPNAHLLRTAVALLHRQGATVEWA
jgi:hypothetical protein